MDTEDTPSTSSSSSTSSPSSPSTPCTHLPPKRKAGRKKFHETRHPVYRGVRARAGGARWVCEVREPRKKTRIWLGTYPTPEMAARAHDVAAIALRGRSAALNFQDSTITLPRAQSSSAYDIRRAAAQAADMYRPPMQQSRISLPSSSSLSLPSLPLLEESTGNVVKTNNVTDEAEQNRTVYIDEDAIFDMPGLVEDMARGMLVTPPAMGAGVDWDAHDDYDGECHMDYTLWID